MNASQTFEIGGIRGTLYQIGDDHHSPGVSWAGKAGPLTPGSAQIEGWHALTALDGRIFVAVRDAWLELHRFNGDTWVALDRLAAAVDLTTERLLSYAKRQTKKVAPHVIMCDIDELDTVLVSKRRTSKRITMITVELAARCLKRARAVVDNRARPLPDADLIGDSLRQAVPIVVDPAPCNDQPVRTIYDAVVERVQDEEDRAVLYPDTDAAPTMGRAPGSSQRAEDRMSWTSVAASIVERFDIAKHNATPERLADALGAKFGNVSAALEEVREQRDAYLKRARKAEATAKHLQAKLDSAAADLERRQVAADEVSRLKASLTDQAIDLAAMARRLGCERDDIELALQTCLDRMHDAEERSTSLSQSLDLERAAKAGLLRRLASVREIRDILRTQVETLDRDSAAAFRDRLELRDELLAMRRRFEQASEHGMKAAHDAEEQRARADRYHAAIAELALMLVAVGQR